MTRMSNFETIKIDYAGISDNCIYEIEEYLSENDSVINFKNVTFYKNLVMPNRKYISQSK